MSKPLKEDRVRKDRSNSEQAPLPSTVNEGLLIQTSALRKLIFFFEIKKNMPVVSTMLHHI